MKKVTVAATQMQCVKSEEENVEKAIKLIRQAANKGANIILIQELFQSQYFCINSLKTENFLLAKPFENHPILIKMSKLASELNVVLPVSFFEKANNAHFNSLAIIDADGKILGKYRKSHIPDGDGYFEKSYFNPGNTGFKVWDTKFGKVAAFICWDQWFPEVARIAALNGAEFIFYPTAIGGEPQQPDYDSSNHWQIVMQGHAAANQIPVIASNRIGEEKGDNYTNAFYGRSFITNTKGEIVKEASRDKEEVILETFDLEENRKFRRSWGVYRDRRVDLYTDLLSLEGSGK